MLLQYISSKLLGSKKNDWMNSECTEEPEDLGLAHELKLEFYMK